MNGNNNIPPRSTGSGNTQNTRAQENQPARRIQQSSAEMRAGEQSGIRSGVPRQNNANPQARQNSQNVRVPQERQNPAGVRNPQTAASPRIADAQPTRTAQNPARRPMQDPRQSQNRPNGAYGSTYTSGVRRKKKKDPIPVIAARYFGRFLLILATTIVILALTVLVSLKMMCSDSSPAAQRMFVTTILETGQMKFLASWFLSPDQIQKIVDTNSMKTLDAEVDDSLISVGGSGSVSVGGVVDEHEEDVYVEEISGSTFFANMIVVKDPSRVSVATIYPWREEGVTLDQIVKDTGALAAINGGLYNSYNNSGGAPYGVVVSNGEIQFNKPEQFSGLVLIGLNEDNILQIINIEGMTAKDIENLVAEKKIRDAVTFQEESSDANNHFVQLVINGEAREMTGMGSGLNPRTAIGQRADGALLLLVTDGRGKSGHLGASASDLINIMLEYGAVNAANLDGGSSSCMYYKDDYLMTSVTFYYSNSSWKLPFAFIVK